MSSFAARALLALSVSAAVGCGTCPRDGERFSVAQRESHSPASVPDALISVGDIRGGAVAHVSVGSAGSEPVAGAEAEMRRSDTLDFSVGGRPYRLWVESYEDHMLHTDIAHFCVAPRP